MNEIRRFGFLVRDSESLTQFSIVAKKQCEQILVTIHVGLYDNLVYLIALNPTGRGV